MPGPSSVSAVQESSRLTSGEPTKLLTTASIAVGLTAGCAAVADDSALKAAGATRAGLALRETLVFTALAGFATFF